LERNNSIDKRPKRLAKVFHTANDFLFLGRGIHYPIAIEGDDEKRSNISSNTPFKSPRPELLYPS
jgi:hypothetical protein